MPFEKRPEKKCEKRIMARYETKARRCNGRGNYEYNGRALCFRHYWKAEHMTPAEFDRWMDEFK